MLYLVAWIAILVIAAVLAIGVPVALLVWARWLAGREGLPRAMRAMPKLVAVLALMMEVTTIAPLFRAFVPAEDPSERATLMAKGISEAMNCCAAGLVLLMVLGGGPLIAGTILLRVRSRART